MKTKIRKQALKIGLLFLGGMALIAGIAAPAYAQTTAAPNIPAPAFHVAQGTVSSVSAPSFVVLTANQGSVTITTDNNTRYFLIPMGRVQGYVSSRTASDNREDRSEGIRTPNPAGQLKELHIPADWRSNLGWLETFDYKATFSDIVVNDRVIVRADAGNLAKQVLIIKAPVDRTVRGTITAVTGNTISITPLATASTPTPAVVTLNWNSSTRFDLKGLIQVEAGQFASAIYNSTNMNALVVNVQATAPMLAPNAVYHPDE